MLTVRRWRWEEPARRPWRRGQGAPEPPCRAEPGACHAGARGGGGTEATSCPARTNERYLPSDPAPIASVAVSLTAQTNHHKRAGRRTKTENRDQTPQQTGNRKADENSRLLYYRPATAAQCNSWPKSPHLRRATPDSWRGERRVLSILVPTVLSAWVVPALRTLFTTQLSFSVFSSILELRQIEGARTARPL